MTGYKPLDGKVALITGGSRGIGAAITRKLASWGCRVCINYVERDKPARALLAELKDQGVEASLHQADLAEPEDIQMLMEEIRALHGDLHILVQNAGATKFTPLADASPEHWDFVQNTNARATWLLAKYAIPLMDKRPGARFITITNSTTTRIVPRAGLFAVAKAGLETLTRYLSYELAPYGVVTNCVRPGLVHTDVFKVRPDFNQAVSHEAAISPWGPDLMTTAENSADVVAMLCLPEAAWIAGQIITVDGGHSLWGMLKGASETVEAV